MAARKSFLIPLLLVLLQVGLLPVWATPGGPRGGGAAAECGCCDPAVETCCCAGENDPAGPPGGCPCLVEDRAPALPTLPPQPGGGAENLGAASAATPCAPWIVASDRRSAVAPTGEYRWAARDGPPLYRLYAVDRR